MTRLVKPEEHCCESKILVNGTIVQCMREPNHKTHHHARCESQELGHQQIGAIMTVYIDWKKKR